MKYAVIKLGTKQFTVKEGDVFEVEAQKQPLNIDVLFLSEGGKVLVGSPVLKDVKITASVVEEKRGAKVRVNRFKSKSRYHKFGGHRQPLSVVRIDQIGEGSVTNAPTSAKAEKAPKTEASEAKVSAAKPKTISKPKTKVAAKEPKKAAKATPKTKVKKTEVKK